MFSVFPVPIFGISPTSVGCTMMRAEIQIEQRIVLFITYQINIGSIATIASVRSATRHVRFAPKGTHPIASVTSGDIYFNAIFVYGSFHGANGCRVANTVAIRIAILDWQRIRNLAETDMPIRPLILTFLMVAARLYSPAQSVPPIEKVQAGAVEIIVNGGLAGSGCIVHSNGIVLTAAHVVGRPGARVAIESARMPRRPARVIAIDYGHDLVLLQAEVGDSFLPTLPLADKLPQPGESVFFYGSAFFRHDLMIRGALGRQDTTFEYIDGHFVECIHITAPTPKGTSGGPWLNAKGEVIGVQSGAMSIGNAPQGISMVAPLKAVRNLINRKTHARTTSMDAAVEELIGQPSDVRNRYKGPPGLVLRQIKKHGVARKAGLEDFMVLTKANGQSFTRTDAFLAMLRRMKPGESLPCEVHDAAGQKSRTVQVPLVYLEEPWVSPTK